MNTSLTEVYGRVILGVFGLFVILFFVYPSPLVAAAEAAAKSLF